MSISSKARFEILRRDGFTCQYCGQKPPAVVLHVDHIVPRAESGSDDPENLITSCGGCNLGKGVSRLYEVTPCRLCGSEGPGMLFDLTDVVHGRASGHGSAFVCTTCITTAVQTMPWITNPDVVRCAGCGWFWELLEPVRFEAGMVSQAQAAWICPDCSLEVGVRPPKERVRPFHNPRAEL